MKIQVIIALFGVAIGASVHGDIGGLTTSN